MTNLSVFQYQSRDVRVIVRDGEPWFVAKDVCTVLELDNVSQALFRLDEDEKRELTYEEVQWIISNDSPDTTRLLAISEPGLYSLVLGSRKPQAKPFKRWVTHEVLPQIRKTGKYEVNPTPTIAPEMSAKDVINFSMDLLTLAGVKEPIRASFGLTAIAKLYPGYSDVVAEAKKLVSAQTTVEELPLSPTELGVAIAHSLGLADTPSAIKVNKVLEELGFQTSNYEESTKGQKKKVWKATPKGEAFSQVQVDTAKSGKTVFKICWFPSVLPEIQGSFV